MMDSVWFPADPGSTIAVLDPGSAVQYWVLHRARDTNRELPSR